MTASVQYLRGGILESEHRVHAAVVDPEGRLVATVGDPSRSTFLRSAAKPFQALPLVEDGVVERFGVPARELALCCASHSGQPGHVEGVRALLARVGVGEAELECGPHPPLRKEAAEALARAGESPGPIHNNCSGKHAGMLALARAHGWVRTGYVERSHPVQRRMLDEVSRWSRVPPERLGVGVDGCGVACFALPLRSAAEAFARFAAAAAEGTGAGAVVDAMTAHPFEVAGTGRLCTALLQRPGGRFWVKTGAEGVYGGALLDRPLGIALKVEDGARRAAGVALLHLLDRLGALNESDRAGLGEFLAPSVRNTRGEEVGQLRAAFVVARGAEA